jgi:hypothetical protein
MKEKRKIYFTINDGKSNLKAKIRIEKPTMTRIVIEHV